MPENSQARQTIDKLSSGVIEAAGELAANAIDLFPNGTIETALKFEGNALEGAAEVGKSVLESAGDILGDAL